MSNTDKNGRPKRTDKEIEEEAKKAINGVIQARKGMAALKIRPEFRKAFPFGPQATEREKSIWEKTVMQATRELEKWPQTLVMAALLAVLSCSTAMAQGLPGGLTVEGLKPVKKQSFAMKHPKLHKAGRKFRRTCQILQPIVSFGGSCAQIVTSIK
ncbi:MAG: hypothetical protein JST01_14390 [Cyanobacteria bacterium SZAS TMP-1]|nr:hypothetical protein [Cyanobacteria bacterium SZAS TMP-1]